MEWILLTIGLLLLAYLIIRPTSNFTPHTLSLQDVNPTNSLPERFPMSFLLHFFHPQEPFYSPDRDYIWDPYHRRWIRNHSGDGWVGLILGIILCIGLLWILGIIGK